MIVALLIVLGVMIALAIDTALEVHRRHREFENRMASSKGADR